MNQISALFAERERLAATVRADLSGQLSAQWLLEQGPMFTAGLGHEFYAALRQRLDDIKRRHDAAWAEEKAAYARIAEIADLIYGAAA
jgi:hypothetical protein